jgi:O-antigen ligase
MFWTWLVAICFSQAVFNRQLKPGLRLLLSAIACGAFYYMIVLRQSWTSGWLPAAVSVWVVLLVARPRWAITAAVVIGGLALLLPGTVNELLLGGDNTYSMETRLEAWAIIWRIVRLSPIFGVGPANYFAYTPLYPILGFSVNFNSHNNYLDIIAQVGFLGLGFFLWFVVALAKVLLRAVRKAPDGFPHAFALGAVGAMAGMLVSGVLGDWMIPFLYNVGLEGFRAAVLGWVFLGAAAALGEPTAQAGPSEDGG